VKAVERLVRIDRHHPEYLLFQTLWPLFKSRFVGDGRGVFDTAAILAAWKHLPAHVLRPERNKRQHLSGVLARMEKRRLQRIEQARAMRAQAAGSARAAAKPAPWGTPQARQAEIDLIRRQIEAGAPVGTKTANQSSCRSAYAALPEQRIDARGELVEVGHGSARRDPVDHLRQQLRQTLRGFRLTDPGLSGDLRQRVAAEHLRDRVGRDRLVLSGADPGVRLIGEAGALELF
jgi:hypothetical protein